MTGNEETQAKKSLKDLKKNMEVNGTVINVGLSGALVDIGAEKPGLLHISALGKDKVNRLQDVLQTGQPVRAWVRKVDPEKGELQLTMVEPLALEWGDIKTGTTVHGKVVRVEQFGVFVDFGAERPGMIHISELSMEYVKDVASVAKVGDEIDALVVEVNRQKRQIRLSRKALETKAEAADAVVEDTGEPEEKTVTAMEAAFLRAQSGEDKSQEGAEAREKRKARELRLAQEEIMRRTLATAPKK